MEDGAKPHQITILTFKSKLNSKLNNIKSIANNELMNIRDYEQEDDILVWSEISAYKGLENHFIFVIECPENEITERQKSLYYISLTRSKSDYYLICSNGSILNKL